MNAQTDSHGCVLCVPCHSTLWLQLSHPPDGTQKPAAQDPSPWPPRTPDDDNDGGGVGDCDFDGDCGGNDSLVRPKTPMGTGAGDGIVMGPDEKEDERRPGKKEQQQAEQWRK